MGKSSVVTNWSKEGAKRIEQRNKRVEENEKLRKYGGGKGVDFSRPIFEAESQQDKDGLYIKRGAFYAADPKKEGGKTYDVIGVQWLMKDGQPVEMPRLITLNKNLYSRGDRDALTDEEIAHAVARGEKLNLDEVMKRADGDVFEDVFGGEEDDEYIGAAWANMADGVPAGEVSELDALPMKEDVYKFKQRMSAIKDVDKKAAAKEKERAKMLSDYTSDAVQDAGDLVTESEALWKLYGFSSADELEKVKKWENTFDKAVKRSIFDPKVAANMLRNHTDEMINAIMQLKAARAKIDMGFKGVDENGTYVGGATEAQDFRDKIKQYREEKAPLEKDYQQKLYEDKARAAGVTASRDLSDNEIAKMFDAATVSDMTPKKAGDKILVIDAEDGIIPEGWQGKSTARRLRDFNSVKNDTELKSDYGKVGKTDAEKELDLKNKRIEQAAKEQGSDTSDWGDSLANIRKTIMGRKF